MAHFSGGDMGRRFDVVTNVPGAMRFRAMLLSVEDDRYLFDLKAKLPPGELGPADAEGGTWFFDRQIVSVTAI
jgi:hypothetical protein